MFNGYEDRKYQIDCEDALIKDLLEDSDCHPLAAVPTGAGKTKIMGSMIYKYLELFPLHRVLILSHTETILRQDYSSIKKFFPGIRIGLYSSGLGKKEIQKITVAGIQSAYRVAAKFKKFDLIIIDEAHTVPIKGKGMYQQMFKVCHGTRIGLTATPFRSSHGYLHKGKGAMFNKLSFDLCTMDGFNGLVEDKYLSKLISKPAKMQLDTNGVKESAGDYNIKDLSKKFDRESITNSAVKELITFGKNYKSWLTFAIDIAHADHIRDELVKNGINAVSLHSKSDELREDLIEKFKNREIRCIVSVGMITTGFDAPNVDLICLLRPTKSPVLHVQMIGRGSRVFLNKSHCLVLDFAGNIKRMGPINCVTVQQKGDKKKGKGKEIVKTCPKCGCLHHPSVKFCDVCGHKFEFKEKISAIVREDEVVKTKKKYEPKWVNVTSVAYHVHSKVGKPDSLKVVYFCGLYSVSEYVCLEHDGWAKRKAEHWVKFRFLGKELPLSIRRLKEVSETLAKPKKLLVDYSLRYPSIIDIIF